MPNRCRPFILLVIAALGACQPRGRGAVPIAEESWEQKLGRFRVRDSVHRADLLRELSIQERRWTERRPARYQYVVHRNCMCFGDLLNSPFVVAVRDGRAEVRDSLGRLVTQDSARAAAISIDTVFADIRDAIREGAPYVEVHYDPRYGFPRYSHTDYPGVTDSFFTITIREFRAR